MNCNKELISQVIQGLKNLIDFDKDSIQTKFKNIAEYHNIKLGTLMQPVRALITGMTSFPSIFAIISIIGKTNSISRLERNIS